MSWVTLLLKVKFFQQAITEYAIVQRIIPAFKMIDSRRNGPYFRNHNFASIKTSIKFWVLFVR